MKDIDFDELDRAVNSLIGGVPSTPADLSPPAAAPSPDVAISAPVDPSGAIPVTTSTTVQPLAARRTSGRFMDVVHPSSDMRSSTPVLEATPVSRSGTMLEPTSPLTVPARPVETSAAPVAAAVANSSVSKPAGEWPDPLDFHASTAEQQPAVVDSAPAQSPMVSTTDDEDSDISKIADDINASLAKETQTPLETPFLSDTKVEKRPLNALAVETAVSAAVVTAIEPPSAPAVTSEDAPMVTTPLASESSSTSEKTEDHPIENDTPLPAELQSDLLNIESNESAASSLPEAQFTTPAAPSTDVPTGPTSIVQQYKESASTGDKPGTALFDTAAYKKPQVKAKKKSSLLVILWIFLLLVVGGGIGAAVYFFVLPLI